jgi:hypothetical protein
VPKLLTRAVTCRAFTVLQNQTEYVTVPPGEVRESLRTSSPVTQITPGFGFGFGDFEGDFVGVGDFDGDGLVDLDGDGLGLLEGVVLFDGLGLCDGFGVLLGVGDADGLGVLVGLADFVGLGVEVGTPDALALLVGCGLRVRALGRGLIIGVLRPDELGLEAGPASGIRVARTVCVDARPQTAVSAGPLEAAKTGATAGPDSKNSPAPVAAATCPTRTILTGTAALR